MTASMFRRKAMKAAKGVALGPPRPRKPWTTKKGTSSNALPNRANPHLSKIRADANETRLSPRLMTVFGVGVLGMSTYCGYLYTSYRREVAASQSMKIPEDVSDRYNHTARTFDADVEMSEKLMRLGAKRRDLVARARGDVLEVSCGTGRNLEYYELGERRGIDGTGKAGVIGCRSITFVDLSPQMVETTRGKFERLHPGVVESAGGRVEFRAQDARDVSRPLRAVPGSSRLLGGQKQEEGYYDTILQTMGVCSMSDPAAALRHLGTITEPQNGRILLLEHGRSHYDWLNRVLDNLAPAHADRHGCWWNRDIGQIVRDSGLEVVEEERYHLGTTWRYVLRPRRT